MGPPLFICLTRLYSLTLLADDTYQHYSILAGTSNLKIKSEFSQEIPIKAVYIHEHYRPPTKNDQSALNDICLIELMEKIKKSKTVTMIKYENISKPKASKCFVSGWGLTEVIFWNLQYESHIMDLLRLCIHFSIMANLTMPRI